MTFIYDALGIVFGPIMRAIFALVGNYGVAIILFTIFCRILMLPSAVSQQKSQAKNARTQMKLRKIQERYKDDRQRQQQEIQEFQRREGVNPMGGCSGMLLQFPIMFGLIAAIYRPLQYTVKVPKEILTKLSEMAAEVLKDDKLKSGMLNIELHIAEGIDKFKFLFGTGKGLFDPTWFDAIQEFNRSFRLFGLDLGKAPSEGEWYYYLIPALAALSQMAVSLYTMLRTRKQNPEQKQNALMMGCMSFGMPLMFTFFTLQFPVGIGMYWITSSLVQLIQTVVLSFTHPPKKMLARLMVEETIVRRSRENSRKKVYEMNY